MLWNSQLFAICVIFVCDYLNWLDQDESQLQTRAGHYTVARRIRRINPSHSFPSVIVAIVSHGHGFQTV